MSESGPKRSLPPWMTGGGGDGSKPSRAKKRGDGDGPGKEKPPERSESSHNNPSSSTSTTAFSKLLEGVVFALSGFVNPERSTLRSQALEMGAEYRQDWDSSCTLLVCAFASTPKFRQVEADCGTIVSKEWISECYREKKLVDIERYLMNVGKPWRKSVNNHAVDRDPESIQHVKPPKHAAASPRLKQSCSEASNKKYNPVHSWFSPSKIKEWACGDLDKTILWLESQEEKPEANEMKMVATEGIIACLQDAIESLTQSQDIRLATEQWKFVPRVVEELVQLEDEMRRKATPSSKDELIELATTCKNIYTTELGKSEGTSKEFVQEEDDAGADSDETIEMTEEEIECAIKQLPYRV